MVYNNSFTISQLEIKLEVLKTQLKTAAARVFSIIGPKLWNALPISLQTAKNINVFKKKDIPSNYVLIFMHFQREAYMVVVRNGAGINRMPTISDWAINLRILHTFFHQSYCFKT